MKPKSGKSSEDSKKEKEREREGKVSVSIRTSQGVPLKKMIDQDTKLKVAIEELLAIEGDEYSSANICQLSCLDFLIFLAYRCFSRSDSAYHPSLPKHFLSHVIDIHPFPYPHSYLQPHITPSLLPTPTPGSDDWSTVEIRYPAPRRIITKKSSELNM
jgi:hypothetical protein